MKPADQRQVDAFMRRLAEGTRPEGSLPSAAQVRMRMLGRKRLARAQRALRPIRIMEGLAMIVGLAGGGVALYLVMQGSSSESVSAPETLSLLGPSLTSGSAMLAVFALAAIVTLFIVATTFSDT